MADIGDPPAVDVIVTVVADQGVAEVSTDQVFETRDRVPLGIATRFRQAIPEIDDNAAHCARIRQQIRAVATNQEVCASFAPDRVVSIAAVDSVITCATDKAVVSCVAGQRVGKIRADQPVDAGQRVALGVSARSGGRLQIDVHAGRRTDIPGRIELIDAVFAADDQIGTRAADKRIRAMRGSRADTAD